MTAFSMRSITLLCGPLAFTACAALTLSLMARSAHAADTAPPDPAEQAEALPPGTRLTALEVVPETIDLVHPFDYRQLLITGVTETGARIDVTRLAQVKAPGEFVEVSDRRQVRPLANGQGKIAVSLAGQSATVPVRVENIDAPHQVSYRTEVGPLLSKLGCNAGTCHGAQQGKNGFKLSLRGYDAVYDYRALTDDLAGRRFNRAAPEKSLMLLKPDGGVPHMGGVLMQAGNPNYELLKLWIAQGVKFDADAPRVARIEISPRDPVIALPDMKQQFHVQATYTDGTTRDVTAEAFLDSSNTEVLEMDSQGLGTAIRRGEAAVLARYEGAYDATTVICMGDREGFQWSDPPAYNHLDELVYGKLRQMRILPSDLCTDAEFIRRIYLDLTGLPPSPDAVRAFLADPRDSREKRDTLVDQLVGCPDFVEHWTNKWADMLQVNRKFLGEQGAWALRHWIRQAVATNMPYDQFVYEVLTASGSTLENPPAAYYKVLREPGAAMENTTQLFLAVRFNCNKCHDHPFERWTQDQYYHLSAFFAQVGRKPAPAYADQRIGGTAVEQALAAVEVVYDQAGGDVTHERTGEIAPPEFPYQAELASDDAAVRREQLARWITSPENQYFAKSYVNRVWSYLLGVGIIEPIDDIRAGNPPSNPALLERLTADFVASGFDVQQLMRRICKSRTYQLSVQTNRWNEDDQTNYSHALARRLPAETLFDAVHHATGASLALPGTPAGFRASQTADSDVKLQDGFLELFGRPVRESACECERSTGVMLGQALNLVNGPTIADAISAPNNRIARLVASHADNRQVIEELFLAILCRPPSANEMEAALETMATAADEAAQHANNLARYEQDVLPQRRAEWERQFTPPHWQVLEVVEARAESGAQLNTLADGSLLVAGEAADKDNYTIRLRATADAITAIRIEALPDDSLARKGPGRAGNFVLNELTLARRAGSSDDKEQPVELTNAQASFSQASWDVSGAIDGMARSGWAVSPEIGKPHFAVFETAADVTGGDGAELVIRLTQQFGRQHTLGRLRLSATSSPRPIRLTSTLPAEVAQALQTPADQRTAAQEKLLDTQYRQQDNELARLTTLANFAKKPTDVRLFGAQDVAWALINSPAFLFNR